jgi:hypothetical protein
MGTELAQFFKCPAKHFSLEIPPKRVNRIAPRGFVSKPTKIHRVVSLLNTRDDNASVPSPHRGRLVAAARKRVRIILSDRAVLSSPSSMKVVRSEMTEKSPSADRRARFLKSSRDANLLRESGHVAWRPLHAAAPSTRGPMAWMMPPG